MHCSNSAYNKLYTALFLLIVSWTLIFFCAWWVIHLSYPAYNEFYTNPILCIKNYILILIFVLRYKQRSCFVYDDFFTAPIMCMNNITQLLFCVWWLYTALTLRIITQVEVLTQIFSDFPDIPDQIYRRKLTLIRLSRLKTPLIRLSRHKGSLIRIFRPKAFWSNHLQTMVQTQIQTIAQTLISLSSDSKTLEEFMIRPSCARSIYGQTQLPS